jgi:DNA-binding CsgD family transcriptional regulator
LAGGPPASRARAEWGRGHVAIYASDYDTGVSSALKAFEVASEMGDRAVVARALKDLGLVESYVDPATGRAKVGEAVSLARASGDIWCLADGLQISAWAAVFQGDVDAAYALLLEANAMAEAMGNRYLIAWHGASAGMIQLLWGDLPNAETLLQNALSAALEVGEPTTYATAVSQLVALDAVRGAFATAHEKATRAFEHLGNLHGLLAVESVEAAVVSCLLAEGRVVEARERSLSLLPAARASSMLFAVASGAILVGRIRLEDNDIDGARDAAGEAAQVAEALGNRWLAASADDVSARIAARTGEIEVAEELHRRALAARVAARFRLAIIDSLEALGWVAVVQRRHAEGVRILGAAEAARESIGYRRLPLDQPGHDAAVAAAEEAMGSADFGSVWAEGATLSLDAVVAYLSRARGQRRRPSMGWASLTPTELDVVRLVAEGLTNPEIGRRLFIAPGTVKTHLAHVFAKLDVANRAALAAQVARRTL